ncbi:CheY-like chemotaxis protein [Arcicella aurantiaca]|uniref:CheY-like chemotaxis protein n=1 Tax=Arcicella aurantiaca TaxID=591202 RepID=A0A316EDL3_9BACT|nr:response regulator [Arcicella aurantiaca]PWK28195.1 CheY-like chemotaxis protein [Arcicella aurantiaca]
MENTYIISDNSDWIQKITKQLELPNNQVLFYQEWREDFLFDDWVSINIKPDISYLIIPIELGSNRFNSFEGLRLAMHIRFMKSHVRYLPIIFISNREEWQIRQMLRDNLDKNHLDYLIGTKGTDFLKPNISEIKAVLENIKPLNEEEYKAQFYDHIHLLPLEEDGGKHSLANIWGALRLNEVLNLNAINDKNLTNRTKELYFKYLRAFHEESKGSFEYLQSLQCIGKRILLIDDEADKGWNDVLKAIFKGADFQFIDFNNKTFKYKKESIKKVKDENWDLILLDLRLNPSEEDTSNKLIKTENYSGAKILKKIKRHNAGIQVIMLTASNKAWNMKKLLDLGADGYYIKESPEFNFSAEFTHESYDNFGKECNTCFERHYLRKIFEMDKVIQKRLDLENGILSNATLNRGAVNLIKVYLKQAFNAIYKYSQTQKEYALYSFLEYYKIAELLGKELIDDNTTKFFIKKKSGNIDFIIKTPLLSKVEPVKEASSTGKSFLKGYKEKDYTPIKDDDEGFYKKPTSSLRFSGLMLLRFGFEEVSVETFMSLNNLRNTVVAHSADNSASEIKVENVISLLEILEKVFQKL